MNPYQLIGKMKKANAEKTLQIRELKIEVNALKKEVAWLKTCREIGDD